MYYSWLYCNLYAMCLAVFAGVCLSCKTIKTITFSAFAQGLHPLIDLSRQHLALNERETSNLLSVYCISFFERCVASLALLWWNCTCMVKHAL